MKLLVATPTRGDLVNVTFHNSTLRLLKWFSKERPAAELVFTTRTSAFVVEARNQFATVVLLDKSYTHLLFIDADMGFSPTLIAKMIELGKPVVGCVYPQRRFDWDAMSAALARGSSFEAARIAGQPFVLEPHPGALASPDGRNQMARTGGFVRADRAGTGIMLIERGVFEIMRARFPELWAPAEGTGAEGGMFQPFAPLNTPENIWLGEDVSFCLRWTQGCGGELWVNVAEPVSHLGSCEYKGSLLAKAETQQGAI